MPTADGWIKSASDTKFTASFDIDDVSCVLSSTIDIGVPVFECNDAVLEYTGLEEVIGTCSFEGTIGKTRINLKLANGATITGTLDEPIGKVYEVSGSGAWVQA